MQTISTNVRGILPGDTLRGSGQRVLGVGPVMRERGTSRYVRVVEVRTRKGDRATRVWNASTTMKVERA